MTTAKRKKPASAVALATLDAKRIKRTIDLLGPEKAREVLARDYPSSVIRDALAGYMRSVSVFSKPNYAPEAIRERLRKDAERNEGRPFSVLAGSTR